MPSIDVLFSAIMLKLYPTIVFSYEGWNLNTKYIIPNTTNNTAIDIAILTKNGGIPKAATAALTMSPKSVNDWPRNRMAEKAPANIELSVSPESTPVSNKVDLIEDALL